MLSALWALILICQPVAADFVRGSGGTSAASGTYRPDADISVGTAWYDSDIEQTSLYLEIDDAVTEPTAGDGTAIRNYSTTDVYEFGLEDITGSLTTVRVWIYCQADSGSGETVDISVSLDGTTWESAQTSGSCPDAPSWTWDSTDFSVSASGASDLRVRLTGGGSYTVYVDTAYVVANP